MPGLGRAFLILAAAAGVGVTPLSGQQVDFRFRATGLSAWFRADPTPEADGASEVRLTQTVVGADATWRDRWHGRLTLGLEGLTVPDGELAPGAWGEGFVDRRHPHTYLHELMVGRTGAIGPVRLAAFGGKGFVPFGSDDPMTRPFLRFPVNHHLAQVLERAVAIAQAAIGPLALEVAGFNGDEPERPSQWPRLARFADSWSARAQLAPAEGVEISASFASVASPEHRPGAGPRQHKLHWSARYHGETGAGRVYALGEGARTTEADGVLTLGSWLGEASLERGSHLLRYRYERTERPEEERLAPFRSVRPHLENAILGTSRWSAHTIGHGWRLPRLAAGLTVHTEVEATVGRVTEVGSGVFDVLATYGRETFWTVTIGLRAGWRAEGHRMGRYGVLEPRHPH
jgi:hypothetical protein